MPTREQLPTLTNTPFKIAPLGALRKVGIGLSGVMPEKRRQYFASFAAFAVQTPLFIAHFAVRLPRRSLRSKISSRHQAFGEGDNLVDLGRSENAAHPVRMDARKRELDEIGLADLTLLKDEGTKGLQKLNLE